MGGGANDLVPVQFAGRIITLVLPQTGFLRRMKSFHRNPVSGELNCQQTPPYTACVVSFSCNQADDDLLNLAGRRADIRIWKRQYMHRKQACGCGCAGKVEVVGFR